jgi:hypothetical protein
MSYPSFKRIWFWSPLRPFVADNRVGGRPLWSSEIPRAGIWRRIFEDQFLLRAQP